MKTLNDAFSLQIQMSSYGFQKEGHVETEYCSSGLYMYHYICSVPSLPRNNQYTTLKTH